MPVHPIVLISGLLIALLAIAAWRFGSAWLRNRGPRAIICPENQRPAGVRVDEGHAALSALKGAPELRLSACSRWPERADCGRQCLAQIESAPDGCLVRNILADWYEGKVCVYCGQPFHQVDWAVQKPALMSAERVSVEWNQIPVDQLREKLAAALPVCFACHMANTLVREHPDLAVDRSALGARRISS